MNEISGTTSGGVPFTARAASRPEAPTVVAWHLLDPPSTPAAMASALPLAGFDAHVMYLGLPLTGARAVHEGFEALLGSGIDLVTEFFGPMHEQASDEFPAAFVEIRDRLGADSDAPLVALGGSAGASVAAEVAVTHGTAFHLRATVLLNPMLRLRPMVDAMAEFLPEPYRWTDASGAVAARMDFVARADELRGLGTPLLVVEGDADEAPFLDAVRAFEQLDLAEVRYVPGVEHALAEWPGTEPEPPTDAARAYDGAVTSWLAATISGH